jgi:HSP20 family protein
MAALVRWTPFRDLMSIQDEMNRLFEDFFRRPSAGATGGTWLPVMDVSESADKITVRMDLPGVTKEDVNIAIIGNTLQVKGEKKQEKEVKEENYHRIERTYGSFFRSVELPSRVVADKITAKFKDGVLTIELPKAEEAKPHAIEIKTEE